MTKRKSDQLHDPHLCVGCSNAGNVIIGDTGLAGCNALVGCAVHGALTWGPSGHNNDMMQCEIRFISTNYRSKHTIVRLSIRSTMNPIPSGWSNELADRYLFE